MITLSYTNLPSLTGIRPLLNGDRVLFQLIDCVLLCKDVCKETVSIRSFRTQRLSQLDVFLDDEFALSIRIEKSVAETLSVKPPGTTQRGKCGDAKQVFDAESTQFIHDHNSMAKTEASRPQDKFIAYDRRPCAQTRRGPTKKTSNEQTSDTVPARIN